MASQEGISQDQTIDPGVDWRLETHTIGDTLKLLPECVALAKLVDSASLQFILGRSGLHTLLAPRNEALEAVAPEDLSAFLRRHLIAGGSEISDLRHCQSVKTEAGDSLDVSYNEGTLRIGNASVVRSDIPCTNGFIQVIDTVLGVPK